MSTGPAEIFGLPGGTTPNPAFTNQVRQNALDRGLIVLTCGIYGNVVRFLSPITIQDNVFAEAMDILEDSIQTARKQAA